MILTAENGWSWGECGYGPDRKAELRAELDKYRAEEGLEPVDWSEDDAADSPLPDAGEGGSHSEPGEGAPKSCPTPQDRCAPRIRRV
jgi:hypothetical protein